MMTDLNRSGGILMHISSLPSQFGIGDLGEQAYRWIDFLDETGTQYWQILPFNPPGSGNSPYQALSAFAGNPMFIDLENLVKIGLLNKKALIESPQFPGDRVDYECVNSWKMPVLQEAFSNFIVSSDKKLVNAFASFKELNASWLTDFACFMAVRDTYPEISWADWPADLRMHDAAAVASFIKVHDQAFRFHQFLQFIFYSQMQTLKEYANNRRIQLIGDIPIFMGYESADVWAHPGLFILDKHRKRRSVAGVPPDFFSEDGQLWGNPLYKWPQHRKDDFSWWIDRIKVTLQSVDMIRLDHFRGFAGYFSIPAGSTSAISGKWKKGPGKSFFNTVKSKIGGLPFIAEDLGVITPDVTALRDKYDLPGMRLLQFAFGRDADHEFLPHNYPMNCVAYTGTHDNNTSLGWFRQATRHEKQFCSAYFNGHTSDMAHEMISMIWRSRAAITIAPMQDFLQLDSGARMNTPSTTSGNWEWRMAPNAITPRLAHWIKEINVTYDRANASKAWTAEDYFADN